MEFKHTDRGTLMRITGVYAERGQLGIYTLIKAVSDLADRLVECGGVGSHSMGPSVKGSIPEPKRREMPRRLRETTGHGELK